MSLFAMTSASHELCTAHQRGENLVVVLTAAQIARDAVRELLPRRVRVRHQITSGRHHEPGHAERTLESLLVDNALLHRTELAGLRVGKALDGEDLLSTGAMREERARVVRDVVHQNGAGPTLA